MMTDTMKCWGIGLKGYVQVRESSTRPVADVTKARVLSGQRRYLDGYDKAGTPRYVVKPTSTTIVNYCWEGGRIVLTLPAQEFMALTGKYMEVHGCFELSPAEVKRLQGWKKGRPA